jgi:diguanylate cyclase (GGDEF)-like protein/PAS domain S-box-containing protein
VSTIDTRVAANRRILVIDDNRAIHEDFRKILAGDDRAREDLDAEEAFLFDRKSERAVRFEIDSAYQGQEGLERLKRAIAAGCPYAVAFVDIRMPPGWDGIETIAQLWKADPTLQVVICTAYSDYSWNEMRGKLGSSDGLLILKKPFDNIEVIQLAHALTQKWTVTRQAAEQTAELQRGLAWSNRIERDLRASEERYSLAARGANDGIWDWDLKNLAFYVAPRWKEMLGFSENEIEPDCADWLSRVHPEDREKLRTQLELRLNDGGPNEFISEHRVRQKDGTHKWMLNRAVVLRSPDGKALRMAGSQSDVTLNKTFDALTSLPNRILFVESIARALELRKKGSTQSFCVMFIDLDRFKSINDSLGHCHGDQVLIEAARRLERVVHSRAERGQSTADVVARLGGDEFAILIGHAMNQEQTTTLASGIEAALSEPLNLGGRSVALSASIGIAFWNPDYELPEEMLRDADTAMYWAKNRGRARTQIFDAHMRAEMVDRLELENDLRLAVGRGELIVEYQPVFHLPEAGSECFGPRLRGFEALVRWRHPSRGLVMPAQFIPVAEENGFIVPLGEFVLREACATMKRWQELYPSETPLDISVNLSPRQLREPNLIHRIDAILKQIGFDPRYLRLEITESVLIDELPSVLTSLNGLKEMGISLEIDDFGTGYSSLSYLTLLPCQTLKIDRAFVMNILEDMHSVEVVRAILALAQNLRMNVIAEAIETQAQLDLLRSLGCRLGQGFYLGRSLSADSTQRLIESHAMECRLPVEAGSSQAAYRG